MTASSIARSELDLSLVVTSLMKGVVQADTHPKVWRHLLGLQARVHDYVAVLGLTVVVDEAEGYAYLRQRDDGAGPAAALPGADVERDSPIPRLVARRALSFPVSLLLALLRKRLAEFDASDSGTKCVLTRQQIVDLLEVFLAGGSSEARLVDQIDAHIAKAVELGFLRRVKDADPVTDAEGAFEVRRILKAFVDGQWLAGLDAGLRTYAVQVGAIPAEDDPPPEPGPATPEVSG